MMDDEHFLNDPELDEDEDIPPKNTEPYPPPVDKLLTLGDVRGHTDWRNYYELGLRKQHIPDLIRMATDDDLHEAGIESLEVWAPLHAWRALGQLGAEEASEPLLGEFWRIEDGDDWIMTDMPKVFAMIGPKAIPHLVAYLDPEKLNGIWPRVVAIECLERIGVTYDLIQPVVIEALKRELEKYERHYPIVNSYLIYSLIKLDAVDAFPLIGRVATSEHYDPDLLGTWDDIMVDRGIIKREDVEPNEDNSPYFPPRNADFLPLPGSGKGKSDQKKKAKRKQSAKSRKLNRKKKRKLPRISNENS